MRSLNVFPSYSLMPLAALTLLQLANPLLADGAMPALTQQSFHTAAGKTLAWKELAGKKATVIVFLSFDCPMSTSYAGTLSELATAYPASGIAIVGLCPGDEDAAKVAEHANEYKLTFPVFKDDNLAAANALSANIVPQVFVLDPAS